MGPTPTVDSSVLLGSSPTPMPAPPDRVERGNGAAAPWRHLGAVASPPLLPRQRVRGHFWQPSPKAAAASGRRGHQGVSRSRPVGSCRPRWAVGLSPEKVPAPPPPPRSTRRPPRSPPDRHSRAAPCSRDSYTLVVQVGGRVGKGTVVVGPCGGAHEASGSWARARTQRWRRGEGPRRGG